MISSHPGHLCCLFVCFSLTGTLSSRAADRAPEERISDKDREYWFFQPLADPAPPRVKDAGGWGRNDIDRFLLARLEPLGISPAPEADPRTLIRRACFDLTGMPPTHAEIQAFAKAHQADPDAAFDKLIDGLLASPQYGERWGRHWLDLVRYGDSNGYKADEYRPHMWRYRDWVIRAINEDMPYDQFVRWQLAGDEIAPGNPDAVTATGFLRLWPYESNQRDAPNQWNIILEDITDITGYAILGLSMGCAKCHDHKFDPILQDDYFRMQAYFAGIYPEDVAAATPEQKKNHDAQMAKWEKATAGIRAEIDEILGERRKSAAAGAVKMFSPELQAMYNKPEPEKTPLEKQHTLLIRRQAELAEESVATKLKDDEKKRYHALQAELKKFDSLKPAPLPTVYSVRDVGPKIPPARIFDNPEKQFGPGLLTILHPGPGRLESPPAAADHSSGARYTFAQWLTRPDNRITTRVIANRLWHYHFGRGIVASANDFGKQGQLPTHPELLDWLAGKFVAGGWSLKKMHKLIMTSSAWRQASLVEPSPAAREHDPGNSLVWRQRVRRLEAESIRDAALCACDELDLKMGGEGISGESTTRRSVYQRLMRNTRTLFLNTFDGPDGFNSCAIRDVTTTAPQALVMLNNSFLNTRAATVAKQAADSASEEAAIEKAFALVLGRIPSGEELSQARDFLAAQATRAAEPSTGADAAAEPKMQTAGFKTFPATPLTDGHAVNIQPGSDFEKVIVTDLPRTEGDAFTVEAVIQLDSLYPDASVRTVASRWNGNGNELTAECHGWSLGITSAKSAHQPNNLILQLVGADIANNPGYEVVASDLRIPLDAPHYVAAVVEAGKNKDGGSVTFYVRDLSRPDSKLHTAIVPHPFAGRISLPERDLVLGGRTISSNQFHGAIARFRLTDHPLAADELLVGKKPSGDPLIDARISGPALPGHLARSLPSSQLRPGQPTNPRIAALVDLSLALLNSNEFLYID